MREQGRLWQAWGLAERKAIFQAGGHQSRADSGGRGPRGRLPGGRGVVEARREAASWAEGGGGREPGFKQKGGEGKFAQEGRVGTCECVLGRGEEAQLRWLVSAGGGSFTCGTSRRRRNHSSLPAQWPSLASLSNPGRGHRPRLRPALRVGRRGPPGCGRRALLLCGRLTAPGGRSGSALRFRSRCLPASSSVRLQGCFPLPAPGSAHPLLSRRACPRPQASLFPQGPCARSWGP